MQMSPQTHVDGPFIREVGRVIRRASEHFSQYTEKQVLDLFYKVDIDGYEYWTRQLVVSALLSTGFEMNQYEVDNLMDWFSKEGEDVFDLDAFAKYVTAPALGAHNPSRFTSENLSDLASIRGLLLSLGDKCLEIIFESPTKPNTLRRMSSFELLEALHRLGAHHISISRLDSLFQKMNVYNDRTTSSEDFATFLQLDAYAQSMRNSFFHLAKVCVKRNLSFPGLLWALPRERVDGFEVTQGELSHAFLEILHLPMSNSEFETLCALCSRGNVHSSLEFSELFHFLHLSPSEDELLHVTASSNTPGAISVWYRHSPRAIRPVTGSVVVVAKELQAQGLVLQFGATIGADTDAEGVTQEDGHDANQDESADASNPPLREPNPLYLHHSETLVHHSPFFTTSKLASIPAATLSLISTPKGNNTKPITPFGAYPPSFTMLGTSPLERVRILQLQGKHLQSKSPHTLFPASSPAHSSSFSSSATWETLVQTVFHAYAAPASAFSYTPKSSQHAAAATASTPRSELWFPLLRTSQALALLALPLSAHATQQAVHRALLQHARMDKGAPAPDAFLELAAQCETEAATRAGAGGTGVGVSVGVGAIPSAGGITQTTELPALPHGVPYPVFSSILSHAAYMLHTRNALRTPAGLPVLLPLFLERYLRKIQHKTPGKQHTSNVGLLLLSLSSTPVSSLISISASGTRVHRSILACALADTPEFGLTPEEAVALAAHAPGPNRTRCLARVHDNTIRSQIIEEKSGAPHLGDEKPSPYPSADQKEMEKDTGRKDTESQDMGGSTCTSSPTTLSLYPPPWGLECTYPHDPSLFLAALPPSAHDVCLSEFAHWVLAVSELGGARAHAVLQDVSVDYTHPLLLSTHSTHSTHSSNHTMGKTLRNAATRTATLSTPAQASPLPPDTLSNAASTTSLQFLGSRDTPFPLPLPPLYASLDPIARRAVRTLLSVPEFYSLTRGPYNAASTSTIADSSSHLPLLAHPLSPPTVYPSPLYAALCDPHAGFVLPRLLGTAAAATATTGSQNARFRFRYYHRRSRYDNLCDSFGVRPPLPGQGQTLDRAFADPFTTAKLLRSASRAIGRVFARSKSRSVSRSPSPAPARSASPAVTSPTKTKTRGRSETRDAARGRSESMSQAVLRSVTSLFGGRFSKEQEDVDNLPWGEEVPPLPQDESPDAPDADAFAEAKAEESVPSNPASNPNNAPSESASTPTASNPPFSDSQDAYQDGVYDGLPPSGLGKSTLFTPVPSHLRALWREHGGEDDFPLRPIGFPRFTFTMARNTSSSTPSASTTRSASAPTPGVPNTPGAPVTPGSGGLPAAPPRNRSHTHTQSDLPPLSPTSPASPPTHRFSRSVSRSFSSSGIATAPAGTASTPGNGPSAGPVGTPVLAELLVPGSVHYSVEDGCITTRLQLGKAQNMPSLFTFAPQKDATLGRVLRICLVKMDPNDTLTSPTATSSTSASPVPPSCTVLSNIWTVPEHETAASLSEAYHALLLQKDLPLPPSAASLGAQHKRDRSRARNTKEKRATLSLPAPFPPSTDPLARIPWSDTWQVLRYRAQMLDSERWKSELPFGNIARAFSRPPTRGPALKPVNVTRVPGVPGMDIQTTGVSGDFVTPLEHYGTTTDEEQEVAEQVYAKNRRASDASNGGDAEYMRERKGMESDDAASDSEDRKRDAQSSSVSSASKRKSNEVLLSSLKNKWKFKPTPNNAHNHDILLRLQLPAAQNHTSLYPTTAAASHTLLQASKSLFEDAYVLFSFDTYVYPTVQTFQEAYRAAPDSFATPEFDLEGAEQVCVAWAAIPFSVLLDHSIAPTSHTTTLTAPPAPASTRLLLPLRGGAPGTPAPLLSASVPAPPQSGIRAWLSNSASAPVSGSVAAASTPGKGNTGATTATPALGATASKAKGGPPTSPNPPCLRGTPPIPELLAESLFATEVLPLGTLHYKAKRLVHYTPTNVVAPVATIRFLADLRLAAGSIFLKQGHGWDASVAKGGREGFGLAKDGSIRDPADSGAQILGVTAKLSATARELVGKNSVVEVTLPPIIFLLSYLSGLTCPLHWNRALFLESIAASWRWVVKDVKKLRNQQKRPPIPSYAVLLEEEIPPRLRPLLQLLPYIPATSTLLPNEASTLLRIACDLIDPDQAEATVQLLHQGSLLPVSTTPVNLTYFLY